MMKLRWVPVLTFTAVIVGLAPTANAVSYSLTHNVKMRDNPTATSSYSAIAPKGSAIGLNCQQWGEAQGPNGNTLWLKVSGSGRDIWWVSDAWTTSPHMAADKTVGISGVPFCETSVTPVPAPSGTTSPPQWLPIKSALLGCARLSTGGACGGTYHNWWAIDFGAAVGTPVFAAGAGKLTVVRSGNTGCSSTSNAVMVDHGPHGFSYYTHLDTISVASGTWVDEFTQIGTVGKTGLSADGCWPHLHYEKRTGTKESTAVDAGKLRACQGGQVVSYPDITGGGTTWTGLPSEKYRVSSDGPWCSLTSIKSVANGRFVTADIGAAGAHYGKLRAAASAASSWERFTFVGDCSSSAGCGIRAGANGRYVSAEVNYTGGGIGMLRARATSMQGWERFRMIGSCRSAAGCGILALGNGLYVAAELNYGGGDYGMLRARATSVQGWERFILQP